MLGQQSQSFFFSPFFELFFVRVHHLIKRDDRHLLAWGLQPPKQGSQIFRQLGDCLFGRFCENKKNYPNFWAIFPW
jgi:hypothetical protein